MSFRRLRLSPRPLPITLLAVLVANPLVLAGLAAGDAPPVDVNPTGEAHAEAVAVGTGDASCTGSNCVAVTSAGNASAAQGLAAASGTGNAQARNVGASGTGDAAAAHGVVSGTGNTSCHQWFCTASSGTGSATGGFLAGSGTGNAQGSGNFAPLGAAVSGTGDASGDSSWAVTGAGDATSRGAGAASGTGDAQSVRGPAVSLTGNATGPAAVTGTGSARGATAVTVLGEAVGPLSAGPLTADEPVREARPANDRTEDALHLGSPPFRFEGSYWHATADADEPSGCWEDANTVWFTVDLGASERFELRVSHDAALPATSRGVGAALFAPAEAGWTAHACRTGEPIFTDAAGPYLLRISWGSTSSTALPDAPFTVRLEGTVLPGPVHDDLASAMPVAGDAFDVTGPTYYEQEGHWRTDATREPGEPAGCAPGAPTVWAAWTAPADGVLIAQPPFDDESWSTVYAWAGDDLDQVTDCERKTATIVAGERYAIQLVHSDSFVRFPVLGNDDRADAYPLTTFPATLRLRMDPPPTLEPGEREANPCFGPDGWLPPGDPDVLEGTTWYRVDAEEDLTISWAASSEAIVGVWVILENGTVVPGECPDRFSRRAVTYGGLTTLLQVRHSATTEWSPRDLAFEATPRAENDLPWDAQALPELPVTVTARVGGATFTDHGRPSCDLSPEVWYRMVVPRDGAVAPRTPYGEASGRVAFYRSTGAEPWLPEPFGCVDTRPLRADPLDQVREGEVLLARVTGIGDAAVLNLTFAMTPVNDDRENATVVQADGSAVAFDTSHATGWDRPAGSAGLFPCAVADPAVWYRLPASHPGLVRLANPDGARLAVWHEQDGELQCVTGGADEELHVPVKRDADVLVAVSSWLPLAGTLQFDRLTP